MSDNKDSGVGCLFIFLFYLGLVILAVVYVPDVEFQIRCSERGGVSSVGPICISKSALINMDKK